jgi:hypothetical protein
MLLVDPRSYNKIGTLIVEEEMGDKVVMRKLARVLAGVMEDKEDMNKQKIS